MVRGMRRVAKRLDSSPNRHKVHEDRTTVHACLDGNVLRNKILFRGPSCFDALSGSRQNTRAFVRWWCLTQLNSAAHPFIEVNIPRDPLKRMAISHLEKTAKLYLLQLVLPSP